MKKYEYKVTVGWNDKTPTAQELLNLEKFIQLCIENCKGIKVIDGCRYTLVKALQ